MSATIALMGDTMLGRGVAERLQERAPESLVAPELAEISREADLCLLNLECCISDRGSPWADPAKPFFFRAPPPAVRTLTHLGVDAVTVANNHALDFGAEALADTLRHLEEAGIAHVGAGEDAASARAPISLEAGGLRIGILACADHPADFAARPDRPGIAYADLRRGTPRWLEEGIRGLWADVRVVTPHWGPNMTPEPVPHVRRAAEAFVEAGADLVAGHSAHVFHGVARGVLYDLGDFLDDYAVDPVLRNDLGLLWLATVDERGLRRVEAVPLRLDYSFTRQADGEDADWVRARLREASAEMGTDVAEEGGRLVVTW